MQPGELHQTLNAHDIPSDFVLSSVYEIETVLEVLKDVEEKIDYFAGLKKHRAEVLDDKIADLKHRSDCLRDVILRTMAALEPKKTTLSFPSLGKVTKRKGKQDWEITNEQSMMGFLEEHGVKDQIVKTEEVVNKSELKKTLDNFEDQSMTVPGVKRVSKPETISVTFESGDDSDDTPEVASPPKAKTKAPKSKVDPTPQMSLSESDL